MRAKWGQNFLARPEVARRIVESLAAGPAEPVLEIGPGRGALTEHLHGRVGRLIAVELDETLFARLAPRFPGIEAVRADFLDWPLPADGGPYAVIGNLPYSAGGAILRKILDWSGWSRAVVMVQKEVALRMIAGPGGRDYGVLSLAVRAKADAVRLFDVPPGAFRPAPQVVSTVVSLVRRPEPRVPPEGEAAFFAVVKAAFGQRRKTLLNSLSHGLDRSKAEVEAALAAIGVSPGRRAETVSLEDYRALAGILR